MLVRGGATIARGLFDALVRPSEFVNVRTTAFASSRIALLDQLIRLGLVWLVNLVVYAVPLTLAGIGFTSEATAPGFFVAVASPLVDSADATWQFLVAFIQNSVFLTVATGLALISFHGSVLAVRHSRGVIQSLHTVVYTTSAYLAGIFTVVMFLSTASGVEAARDFVLNLQANFIYGIIDFMGSDLVVPGVEPGPVTTEGFSQTGVTLLAVLVVLVVYFVYSMYLGARVNHGMSRLDSSLVVVGVLASPVVYILGSVLFTIVLGSQPL